MKLRLFIHPQAALASGSLITGIEDYEVSPVLVEKLRDLNLLDIASKFVETDIEATTPSKTVHRLSCAAATDDAVLDALGILCNQVEKAKDWAEPVLLAHDNGTLSTPPRVPGYVIRLWLKFPHGIYRPLLGDKVAEAIGLSEPLPAHLADRGER